MNSVNKVLDKVFENEKGWGLTVTVEEKEKKGKLSNHSINCSCRVVKYVVN